MGRAKASTGRKNRQRDVPAGSGASCHPTAQRVQRDKAKSEEADSLERGHHAGDPACLMSGVGLGRSESRQASQADAADNMAPCEKLDASVAEQTAVALAPTEFETRGTESIFSVMLRRR